MKGASEHKLERGGGGGRGGEVLKIGNMKYYDDLADRFMTRRRIAEVIDTVTQIFSCVLIFAHLRKWAISRGFVFVILILLPLNGVRTVIFTLYIFLRIFEKRE